MQCREQPQFDTITLFGLHKYMYMYMYTLQSLRIHKYMYVVTDVCTYMYDSD